LPSEVVFVNDTQNKSTALPTNIVMHIQINLGNRITVSYHNLQARLTGHLTVTQTARSLLLASGELNIVNGEYRAYGKLLHINNGRLLYTGNPVSNPGLNIRATQTIRTVTSSNGQNNLNGASPFANTYTGTQQLTVGVQVTGTLNSPVTTLFSDPSGLSQDDILSYLLFGYPKSNITAGSSLALLNAMLINPNGGVGGLPNKLQQTLGLTELNVGSTQYFNTDDDKTEQTTTVSVGKQLGNKLSLHYSVSIFNNFSILNVRYQLSKRWAVQSETSTQDNGGDLLYEFERD
jgi:translocation and assembly module TamB